MAKSSRRLLIALEQKFGRLAIPGLLRWIATFQALVWGLLLVAPDMWETLRYQREAIFSGQVWRLVSFVLLPVAQNPLFVLFVLFFTWFINDALEQAWGEFRLNLYIVATIVSLSGFGLIPGIGIFVEGMAIGLFYSAMFFAFASIYPNQVINLFGVIPIKAKWLGLVNLLGLVYGILQAFNLSGIFGGVLATLTVIAALLPYLCVFAPEFFRNLKAASENAARRSAYQEKVEEAVGDAFHTCDGCGKTDVTNPDLEFRVTSDGKHEFCIDCLPSRKDEEVQA